MTASGEIRKAYIPLIGTATGLQGYDTSAPISLHADDLEAYFTVTHINTTETELSKGDTADNMAFRNASPIVTLRVDVFKRHDLGFISSASVEAYASQIEPAIKRQLQADGYSILQTELDDMRPIREVNTDRISLTFRHWVSKK